MHVHYLGVWNKDADKAEPKPTQLVCEKDLSSYSRWTKNTVGDFMTVFAEPVVKSTPIGGRSAVDEQSYTFHSFARDEGICAVVITDHEYPKLVAQQILNKIADEFVTRYPRSVFTQAAKDSLEFPQLKEYMTKYQDPSNADSIMKIQKELDETKIVLHKTIESVLERGEKIDSLVAKSDGLSAQSKMFYTQAKKQNSCCVVM